MFCIVFMKDKGMINMGQHTKSNRETRKRKYAEQLARTAENKKRKAEKREKKFGKQEEYL